MNYNRLTVLLLTFLALTIISCDKSEEQPDTPGIGGNGGNTTTYKPGKVELDFSNMANAHGVDITGATAYANNLGQAFRVSKFRYYVSNIVFIREDGSEYNVSDIYHLVDESETASRKISCYNVPGGKYTSCRFLLGVDAARVASGNFTGDLDPSNGMFWSNSDGFVAMELDGTTNYSPDSTYSFKIGGLGVNNALKTITCPFNGQTLIVNGTRTATIHLFAEILDAFRVPQNIDFFTTHHISSPGTQAMMLADNYSDMIRFDHLHN
jgi:hypothetical protein